MKNKTVIAAVMTLCVAFSGSAMADGHGRGHQDEREHGEHDNNPGWGHGRGHDADRGHDEDQARFHGRGAGPRHDLHKGQHLPREYRSHQYVVNDWRNHRLSAPPRGYQWVQTGGDYVLVAVGSGIILNIRLN
jgi:Ni/Co efflux regulator RcnB